MRAIDIFMHSIMLVRRNPGAAIRLSLPYLTMTVLVDATLKLNFLSYESARNSTINGIAIVLLLIACAWVAVAWHRYVLREEMPSALLPTFSRNLVLGYLGRSILLGLAIIVPLMALSIFMKLLVPQSVVNHPIEGSIVVEIFVWLPVSWLFYRWSLILPAWALHNRMSFRESWKHTSDVAGMIFVLCVIFAGVQIVLDQVTLLLSEAGIVVASIADMVLQWLCFMIAVSVLTTLYGHLVENRDLN